MTKDIEMVKTAWIERLRKSKNESDKMMYEMGVQAGRECAVDLDFDDLVFLADTPDCDLVPEPTGGWPFDLEKLLGDNAHYAANSEYVRGCVHGARKEFATVRAFV
ncbi:MAG TPA: hypothetical protein VFE46_14180 [Pirellulales bacterium]|jgi:hypothetical protein|nr:hypothetical protein [Pirellulales bacterium]